MTPTRLWGIWTEHLLACKLEQGSPGPHRARRPGPSQPPRLLQHKPAAPPIHEISGPEAPTSATQRKAAAGPGDKDLALIFPLGLGMLGMRRGLGGSKAWGCQGSALPMLSPYWIAKPRLSRKARAGSCLTSAREGSGTCALPSHSVTRPGDRAPPAQALTAALDAFKGQHCAAGARLQHRWTQPHGSPTKAPACWPRRGVSSCGARRSRLQARAGGSLSWCPAKRTPLPPRTPCSCPPGSRLTSPACPRRVQEQLAAVVIPLELEGLVSSKGAAVAGSGLGWDRCSLGQAGPCGGWLGSGMSQAQSPRVSGERGLHCPSVWSSQGRPPSTTRRPNLQEKELLY